MTLNLNGSTRLIGIVGYPVAQARAPEIWTPLFAHNKMNAVCVPFHVHPDHLDKFVEGIGSIQNVDGLIVTVPHKPAALALTDGATERAQRVGSVNVIRWDADGHSFGDILDGLGFIAGLKSRGQTVAGKRALVVGCGGVGKAIAFALAEEGVASVSLTDSDNARAVSLAAALERAGTRSDVVRANAEGYEFIVNASPIGMGTSDPLPLDCSCLAGSAVVCDVVMHPVETPLLRLAASKGCFVHPGTYMMDYQLQMIADFFGFKEGNWSATAADQVASETSVR